MSNLHPMSSPNKPETAENPIRHNYYIVAIDLAKKTLVVKTSRGLSQHKNSPEGIRKLIAQLPKDQPALFVFEATGCCNTEQLMDILEEHKIGYCQVRPDRISAFAKSEGKRAKSDPIDAAMIYKFAVEKDLCPIERPDQKTLELRALMDRRSQLVEMQAVEKTRLKNCSKYVKDAIRKNIKHLDALIEEVEQQIQTLIATQTLMRERYQAITKIRGVGAITAWTILAYASELPKLNRAQAAALAGLCPYDQDSGTKKGKRYIIGGRAQIRRVLYMAAHCASTHNEHIRNYVQRLLERGKPYKSAMVAAMRKLLICIQSIIKGRYPMEKKTA